MWIQFAFENAHFALNLGAAGVLFAIFWLYADAWLARKSLRDLMKIIGYLMIALSYLVHATYVESSILTTSFFSALPNDLIVAALRIPGYVCLIFSLAFEPLQDRPWRPKSAAVALLGYPVMMTIPVIYPILSTITGFLYLRRATVGLEDHIKRVAIGFFLISVSDLLNLPLKMTGITNSDVFALVAPFGPLWIVHHLVLAGALVFLASWVFSYLLKRFQTQLFMFFTTSVVVIFLITTITFTGLLLSNLQQETLREMETNVRVLSFSLESKKGQLLSDASSLAQNPQLPELIETTARKPLSDLAQSYLLTKKQTTLLVVNSHGQVVARAEDRDRVGDSVGNDPLIQRALAGESIAAAVVKEGVVTDQLHIQAAVPVKKDATLIGAILIGVAIDNAFVDGIKASTGLDSSMFTGNTLAATTLTASGSPTRLIGIVEHTPAVLTRVLKESKAYTGTVTIVSNPYLSAYLPITDIDNTPVGMMFVGRKEIGVLETASRSIEITFIVTVILTACSIIPSFFIARSIARQV